MGGAADDWYRGMGAAASATAAIAMATAAGATEFVGTFLSAIF
jgi:hypothetical protein